MMPRMHRLTGALCALLLVPAIAVACAPADESSPTASPTTAGADTCTKDKLATLKPGTLTLATDQPAYAPWFDNDDPANGKDENLGMPFKGVGVNEVTADEKAGLAYVVTCEEHHWVVLDLKTKKYHEPAPDVRLTPYAQTLIDHRGRAVVMTRDFQVARYDPATKTLELLLLASDGQPVGSADDKLGPACWALGPGGTHAYLVRMSDSRLFRIDLAPAGAKLPVADLGKLIDGKGFDSRGSLIVGHDGKVYALGRVNNETGFGKGNLHHLLSYDPAAKKARDHGVLVVKNPDWFDFSPGKDGKPKPWSHGFHTLPDGTWTPLHAHMALAQAKDGTLYGTVIYPFTLLRIDPADAR